MSGFDILGDDKPRERPAKESSLFRDVVWIWEIPSSHLVAVLAQAVRKQLDTVENYAQFVARRLQESGILVDVLTSMTPTTDGYTLTITFRVRGVRKDVLEKRFRLVKKIAKEITKSSVRYKRAEEILARLRQYDRARESGAALEAGDTSSRASEEEAGGEG
ncbi:MAG: hypothetical protein DRJ38_03565 [Thermoprotei archaeon]|nr:MAG: hypothetical protein DRJ38_03565 [Thermoprotei archaeon]